jgi:hypothetical protein
LYRVSHILHSVQMRTLGTFTHFGSDSPMVLGKSWHMWCYNYADLSVRRLL